MILTLDVGNTQIFGGITENEKLVLQFRRNSKGRSSSDEMGLFLRQVLRENNINPDNVRHIAICSVVPDIVHSLINCSKKYFNMSPFILQAGVKTGLKIKYRNPLEVGTDRIANSIGANHLFPNRNIVIIDFGTATTLCAVNADKAYLGGLIMPGLRLSMESLVTGTAKLPAVEIAEPASLLGRTTIESIQSGLYYGHLTSIREISKKIIAEYFNDPNQKKPIVVGTGGFARLFSEQGVFDAHLPELVHIGLKRALFLNI